MTILMKYEGVEGESELADKTGFIILTSFNWGLSRAVSAVRPGSRARVDPAIQEVTFTKLTDNASVGLVEEALNGRFDRKVEVHFLRPGPGGEPQEYVKYVLMDCGLSSYSVSSGGDTPSEAYTLNFTGIQFLYFKFADDLTATPSDLSFFLPDASIS